MWRNKENWSTKEKHVYIHNISENLLTLNYKKISLEIVEHTMETVHPQVLI